MAYSDYERFKWESMAHFGHRTGLGGPRSEAGKLTDDASEQAVLVRRLVLELFDQGLVFGAYATYRDAYSFEWHEFIPVSRELIERELDEMTKSIPVEADPEDLEWFWIFPTAAGEHAMCSQPADAFLEPPPDHIMEARRRWLDQQGA